jgi:hypothetical protein
MSQHRFIREGASNPIAKTIESNSFEKCFSAGLDLTEFDGGEHSSTVTSSWAAKAQEQVNVALSRRNQEDIEEAALERRVADVFDAAKRSNVSSSKTDHDDDDVNIVVVVPKAIHPTKNTDVCGELMGVGREDNFIKFHNGTSSFGGNNTAFLSSLVVSNHKAEVMGGTLAMSHKSRQLKKQCKTTESFTSKSISLSAGFGTRRPEGGKMNSAHGKVTAKKKLRKTKF